ncbi:MAG: FAD-dependent oxidoreductase [Spirochaetaceae bacterium]|nr:FAD-dependent oxidoreductase [Spirochaetaceae bacterium]
MDKNEYDVIIVGGGPAGLSAALYNGRARLKTILFEKTQLGGQIAISSEIGNYPGYFAAGHSGLSATALVDTMIKQAEAFGTIIEKKAVKSVDLAGKVKKVTTGDGEVYSAKAVIIATGAQPRRLGCKGEVEYIGKGISYCATCDADFFADFEVFCVGGGDTAVEEAIYLAKFARKVTLIVRKDHVRAAASIMERAEANEKIEIKYNTELLEVSGEDILQQARFKNNKTGEEWLYNADEEDGFFGVFVFVGYVPLSHLVEGILDLSQDGYVLADEEMKTKLPGVFACGDIRPKMLRQVVTAAADGAIAAISAQKYIEHG